jgi:hypothetical protein
MRASRCEKKPLHAVLPPATQRRVPGYALPYELNQQRGRMADRQPEGLHRQRAAPQHLKPML